MHCVRLLQWTQKPSNPRGYCQTWDTQVCAVWRARFSNDLVWDRVNKSETLGLKWQGSHQEPEAWDFLQLLWTWSRLLSWENGRKIEPKEIPSCSNDSPPTCCIDPATWKLSNSPEIGYHFPGNFFFFFFPQETYQLGENFSLDQKTEIDTLKIKAANLNLPATQFVSLTVNNASISVKTDSRIGWDFGSLV